jgi:Zn-dependent protease
VGGTDISGIIHDATTWVLPILIAIPLHEAAHGFVAFLRGDRTAYMMGRVTFNPLKHIDPFGSLLLPALLWLTMGFPFGYAKPVPVDFRKLHNPKRDMIWVAAAGPGINFVLAIITGLLFHLVPLMPAQAQAFLFRTLINSLELNIGLALFNLIPLPPMDGGRIAVGILPRPLALPLARLERYGMLIILAVIFILPRIGQAAGMNLDILDWILGPPYSYVLTGIARLTGIGGLLGLTG